MAQLIAPVLYTYMSNVQMYIPCTPYREHSVQHAEYSVQRTPYSKAHLAIYSLI